MANTGTQRVQKHRAAKRECATLMPHGIAENGVPICASPEDRARFASDLCGFAHHCFPHTFYKPDSAGQASDWKLMQDVVIQGGQFAFAAPRGDGKSCRCEAAAIWAAAYGYHPVIVLIGAEQDIAVEMLDSIKLEFRTNDALMDMFPEICVPAREADDTALRAKAMTYNGEDIHFRWGARKIVLPVVADCPSGGVIIVPRGLTSRIRGMRFKHPDGRTLRPSLLLPDDPQTDKSAASEQECKTRERIITAAILGTAGHGKAPTALMPCTIIKRGDLVDRILDREKHPEWHGRKRGMVVEWGDEWEKDGHGLWGDYMDIRRECQRADETTERANEFYRERRDAMDAGCVVDWVMDENNEADTAIQYAVNLVCDRGEEVFAAEYQNDPIREGVTLYTLTPEVIKSRTQQREPGAVPEWAHKVVCATDINRSYALSTVVCAFGPDQTAAVLWYGLAPIRVRDTMTEGEQRQRVHAALSKHGQSIAGLACRPDLWVIDGGGTPEGCVIEFANNSPQSCGLQAVTAFGRNARKYAIPRRDKRKVIAHHEAHRVIERRDRQWLVFNACYWREMAQVAWVCEPGAPGSCTLPSGKHDQFAEQVCGDKIRTKGENELGEMRWEWDKVGKNDLGDCMTMCYMAAAVMGIGPAGTQTIQPRRQRRIYHAKW